ncbi:MAG TPA: hypothetical protein VMN78_09800 [Longimicrobiales bacterium]|nr:hypothetical protein [Longimicrobiales bacterium]
MKQSGAFVMLALTTLVLQALPARAGAQLRPGMGGGPPAASQFRIYAMGGWAEVDVDEMNARLGGLPEPYTPVDDDMVVVGGGLHARMKRVLAGVEGAVLLSLEEAQVADARRAAFSGFHGAILVGFSILQTEGLDIYPLVQLGGAGASLEVQERGDPSWDDVLGDPGRSSTLSTFTVYGAGGVGIEYAFPGGFFAGLRGTWAYTPSSDGWSAEDGDVLGGPEVALSGPNLRLMIGFGGRGGR